MADYAESVAECGEAVSYSAKWEAAFADADSAAEVAAPLLALLAVSATGRALALSSRPADERVVVILY